MSAPRARRALGRAGQCVAARGQRAIPLAAAPPAGAAPAGAAAAQQPPLPPRHAGPDSHRPQQSYLRAQGRGSPRPNGRWDPLTSKAMAQVAAGDLDGAQQPWAWRCSTPGLDLKIIAGGHSMAKTGVAATLFIVAEPLWGRGCAKRPRACAAAHHSDKSEYAWNAHRRHDVPPQHGSRRLSPSRTSGRASQRRGGRRAPAEACSRSSAASHSRSSRRSIASTWRAPACCAISRPPTRSCAAASAAWRRDPRNTGRLDLAGQRGDGGRVPRVPVDVIQKIPPQYTAQNASVDWGPC